jgi:hypothetical protein
MKLGVKTFDSEFFLDSFINKADFFEIMAIEKNNYTLPRTVPWSECFVVPAGGKSRPFTGEYTHNYSMDENDDVRIITQFEDDNKWPQEGTITGEYKNVSCLSVNGGDFIYGNVTLINNTSELPADQTGMVFLVNETEGCEYILDNITNASAAVLLHTEGQKYAIQNFTKYSFPIERANASDENLTNITERLRNDETILADNLYDNTTITFNYGFPVSDWPDYNFMIITEVNTTTGTLFGKPVTPFGRYGIGLWLTATSAYLWWENRKQPDDHQCKGLIIYSEKQDGTHYMWMHNDVDWSQIGGAFPLLPVLSVNNTVGGFLYNNSGYIDNTVSGFINQEYYREHHGFFSQRRSQCI